MATADTLSPPGSSTYSSNTLTVGDGTWDSTKNDFLLPPLVGLNFETMQYNGMGNRFASLEQYHTIVRAHAIIAVITFLFLLPASIMMARFYAGRIPGRGVKIHIYLNILVLGLSTVVFILGWFAVGPARSLTNPHHGIGVAIYVLILVQVIGGNWMRKRIMKHPQRRPPIKLMLHQWLGRAIVLLGIVQVPLGLTLYGSPKFTFVLYTLWMTFLLLLYFIFSYRAAGIVDTVRYSSHGGGTVISERKSGGGFGKYLAPLAVGGVIAALLNRRKSKREDRRDSRVEVIPSRRGSRRESGSFIEEEKFTEERRGGGWMNKLLAAGAVAGAAGLAKSFFDRRKADRAESTYASVAPDTPSRRRSHRNQSEYSESTVEVHRVEHDRRHGPILPGPGNPVAAAAALSAAEPRPMTPLPAGRLSKHRRASSYDSYSSVNSPSRRKSESHGLRNGIIAGLGLGWLGKKFKDRRDDKEQQRLDDIRAQEIEDERRLEDDRRRGHRPPRFTGDGIPPPPRGGPPRSHGRRDDITDSDLSTDLTSSRVETRPTGLMPPLPAGVVPSAAAAAAYEQDRRSTNRLNEIPLPSGPPRADTYIQESGSEAYQSPGGRNHRRHSSRRREAEAAAATAGVALAAAEEERRRREDSHIRDQSQSGFGSARLDNGPAATVHVKLPNDRDRTTTVRRLTAEEEAERRRGARRNRSDSASSLSASDAPPSRRYRREESTRRNADLAAERRAEDVSTPLSPPRPAFAGGRQPKDSAYYSGQPHTSRGALSGPESLGSPESHGTWSGMSPTSGTGLGDEDPAERRRRRRMERNQRQGNTVDFT